MIIGARLQGVCHAILMHSLYFGQFCCIVFVVDIRFHSEFRRNLSETLRQKKTKERKKIWVPFSSYLAQNSCSGVRASLRRAAPAAAPAASQGQPRACLLAGGRTRNLRVRPGLNPGRGPGSLRCGARARAPAGARAGSGRAGGPSEPVHAQSHIELAGEPAECCAPPSCAKSGLIAREPRDPH